MRNILVSSLIILAMLYSNIDSCHSSRISVIGIALEDKGGAIVETDQTFYFVDGLDEWDEKYYGKKVKVTGVLKLEKHEKESTDSLHVQEIVGTIRTLKRAKWYLLE